MTASIYNAEEPRALRSTLGLATAAIVASAGVVFVLAFEDLLCLAMAFPLALTLVPVRRRPHPPHPHASTF